MSNNDTQIKRKRGRPRKNVEKVESKEEEKREKPDENIVLFLALSDDESQDSGEDNRFTVNDYNATSAKNVTKTKIVDSLSDTESVESEDTFNNNRAKHMSVKTLIEEVKKRDLIIANLKNKNTGVTSAYSTSKPVQINYHCVNVANSDGVFSPQETDCKCWWCDESFDNLPAYIAQYFRNNTYYVFGNFCSFNCALKYNLRMLKDFKFNTRHTLTYNLCMKVTGDNNPVKLAGDRELLKSKGGQMSIERFRSGFSVVSPNMKMNMPPMIPLVHIVEEGRRD